MAHDGYFSFAGNEIVNAGRTTAYAKALTPMLQVDNCVGCDDLRLAVNLAIPGNPTRTGADIELQTRYTTPKADLAPWYDANDPDTEGFAGFLPLSVSGIVDSTREANVIEGTKDGGSIGRPRRKTKEVRMSGVLIAKSEPSLEAGMRWLKAALQGRNCNDVDGCDGYELRYFDACPDSIPLGGTDHLAPPIVYTFLGNEHWEVFGGAGTFTADGTLGKYTTTAPAGEYLRYTPVGAVDDTITFKVDFSLGSAILMSTRTNLIKNPNYTRGTGTSVVRRNYEPRGLVTVLPHTGAFNNTTTISGFPVGYKHQTWTGVSAVPYNNQPIIEHTSWRTDVSAHVGDSLTHSFYFKPTGAPLGARALIKWHDITDAVIATSVGTAIIAPSSTAARPFVTDVVPVGAVSASYEAQGSGSGNWPATVSYANPLIEFGTDVGTYFDGTTPSVNGWTYAWLGTAFQSESIVRGQGITGNMVVDLSSMASGGKDNGARSTSGWYIFYPHGALTGSRLMSSSSYLDIPAVAGDFYSARIRMRQVGGVASSGVHLVIRALDGTGAYLSDVATGSTATLTVGTTTSAWVDVIATSTAALPAGTAYLEQHLYADTDTAARAEMQVDSNIVEKVTGTGIDAGTYFDGDTPDTGSIIYAWTGLDRSSTSTKKTYGTTPVGLWLQAWGDDSVLLGSVLGTSSGAGNRMELTVDTTGYTTVNYRIVPLGAADIYIESTTIEVRPTYGFDTLAAAYVLFPSGGSPPTPTVPAGPDPIGTMILNSVERYRRTLRQVTCVSGPSVIRETSSCNGWMMQVEFVLVAGRPYQYSAETLLVNVPLGLSAYAAGSVDPNSKAFLFSGPLAFCAPMVDPGPLLNPNCDPIPDPPALPGSTGSAPLDNCGAPSGPVVRRIAYYIDHAVVPDWGEVVADFEFAMPADTVGLTVRFYPAPIPGTPVSSLDPCSARNGMVVNYMNSNGMVVSGSEQRAYSRLFEANGSGRYIDQQAIHLLSDPNGGPFNWPALTCGIGYYMIVDLYEDLPTGSWLNLSLAARE